MMLWKNCLFTSWHVAMDGVLFFAWGSGIVHKEKRKKGGGNLVIVVAVIGGFGLVGGI